MQSIPSFAPSSFKLDTGLATIGEYEQVTLIGMRFSLAAAKNIGYQTDIVPPLVVESHHVAVMSFLYPDGHDQKVVLICKRLKPEDRLLLLECWSQWLSAIAKAHPKGLTCWMAASSTPARTWSLDDGFWSAISFEKKQPVSEQVVDQSTDSYGVGTQL